MSIVTLNTVDDLTNIVNDSKYIHVSGNNTKTALKTGLNTTYSDQVERIQLTGLSDITEYQPDEYTITVRAGTPVKVMQDALLQHGQYLPFDPMLASSATIGGTVAANLSGSRRWRYGGIRDFILGATVVDGLGRAFRVGGKVVKNSAGFDLTKFLVGSLGLYAIMTEITFKVFPDVSNFTTLKLTYHTLDALLSAVYFLNQSVFELDALDFEPEDEGWTLWVRITGLEDTLAARVDRLISNLQEQTSLADSSEMRGDNTIWDTHNALSWSDNPNFVKVILSPKQIPSLEKNVGQPVFTRRYSIGGNVAWFALDDTHLETLKLILQDLDITGIQITGNTDGPILGKPIDNVLSDRVKHILDPQGKLV